MQAEALFKPAPVAKPAKAKVAKADDAAPVESVVAQVAGEAEVTAAISAEVAPSAAEAVLSAEATTPEPTTQAMAEKPAAKADEVVRIPAMGGRKMQEALRGLREQWKKIDKEAAPNPALWKRFDTACNRAHEVVDAWLKEARAQTTAHKAQRLALIEEVKAWASAISAWRRAKLAFCAFSSGSCAA